MKDHRIGWLILLAFLLLKLIAPPGAALADKAAAFIGLERETIDALGGADTQRGLKIAWIPQP